MLTRKIRNHNSGTDNNADRGMANKQTKSNLGSHLFSHAVIAAWAALGATTASAMPNPYPQPMPGQTLLFPTAGVVCDQTGQTCFDSNGLSLGLTRQYFGAYAEQNVLRNLNGQPAPRQFRLSNGAACDANQRLCWSDGWAQRVVDRNLSSQLFGNNGGGGGGGSDTNSATGLCRLTQGFRTVYNGQCDLKELTNNQRKRFVVNLSNGSRYSFEDRGNGYRITDGMGGSWPVSFNDQGRSALFRWADMSLSVTQNAYQGGSSVGRALGNLLEALFN